VKAQHQRLGPLLQRPALEGPAHAVDKHHHVVRSAALPLSSRDALSSRSARGIPDARSMLNAGISGAVEAAAGALAHG